MVVVVVGDSDVLAAGAGGKTKGLTKTKKNEQKNHDKKTPAQTRGLGWTALRRAEVEELEAAPSLPHNHHPL